MKPIIFMLIISIVSWIPRLNAQEVITDEINYNTMEELIQLAKDHYPQRKIVDEQEKQAKNDVTIENLSYLDMVNVSYFWRPDRKQAINEVNPYITNGIQVGVNLSPGRLISRPLQVKNAKSDHEITKLRQKAFDAELENQVKSLYYNYVLQLRNFKQKSLESQTEKSLFLNISESFQRGEITMEDYDKSRTSLSSTEYSRLQSEISFLRARDDLEEIVGIKLTDIKN